ncbi:MAG TPA: hypothetical protein VFC46_10340 [Humisphaera sp.]|nr:hypothetical protein [Humisphaera sp.]
MSVIVAVQPNEINHVAADSSVTVILDTEDWIPVPLTETPPMATLGIANTDADTVVINPRVLGVDDNDTIPVTVTNYYGRPANVNVNVTQYDPAFVTLPTTPVTTDACGVAELPAEALEFGTMGELLDVVANASQASGTTSPVGTGSATLRAWGISPESVVNGVPGAELTKADRPAGIYVPESHDDTDLQSAASYWAPFIVHLTSENPLTFIFPDTLQVNTQGDGSGAAVLSGESLNLAGNQVLYVKATKLVDGVKISVADTALQASSFDWLKVTSFGLQGPNDVPQFGTYEYTTLFPNHATPASAGWQIASGGAMALRVNPVANPSDAFVTWGAGPLVGTAIYGVTANFSWHLDVNVVQVSVTTPTSFPAFVPGTATQQNSPVANRILVSSDHLASPGLTWNAAVTFTGPNGNQGVSHIMAGFVQNLKVTSFSGTYGPAPLVTAAPYYGGLTMVGQTFWDHINKGYGKFYAPSSREAAFISGADQLLHPAHTLIQSSDSPGAGPPVFFKNKQVSAMSLIWDFNLFVAATTDEANNVYAAQALATWQFNASGSFNASKIWTSSAPKIPGTLIPQIITPPSRWIASTQDSSQPVVDTTPFNDIIQPPNFIDRWK